MIKMDKAEVTGWEAAIRGMRNPMNSWLLSDTDFTEKEVKLGTNDYKLAMQLATAGGPHAKYRRMIVVYVDILAPLYWWKEYDTYKVGTVTDSCSTMHKIHSERFSREDFSCEHLKPHQLYTLDSVIQDLNDAREAFIRSQDKDDWWQMIQLLPASYNQLRTCELNYEVLSNIYYYRKDHKLDEWRELCKWSKSLPYSNLITLKKSERHE